MLIYCYRENRYFHVRMFFLRPLLSRYCTLGERSDNPHVMRIEEHTLFSSSVQCVEMARELVETIYTNISENDDVDLISFDWFNILGKLCVSST